MGGKQTFLSERQQLEARCADRLRHASCAEGMRTPPHVGGEAGEAARSVILSAFRVVVPTVSLIWPCYDALSLTQTLWASAAERPGRPAPRSRSCDGDDYHDQPEAIGEST